MTAILKNILYFCNVKNQTRHDVAAKGSVFCVLKLSENYNRIERGSSNAHIGFAFDTLTARNAVSLCQKLNV